MSSGWILNTLTARGASSCSSEAYNDPSLPYRYFTWDTAKFPSPEAMQDRLAAKGRKMVTIIDPHIKRDGNYHIHKDAEASDVYVKRADGGGAYEGWCWPGSSSWIDFLSATNRKWWAEQLSPDKYQVSAFTTVL